MMNDLHDMIQVSCEEAITPDVQAQLEHEAQQPTGGRCEDAPCCGCCDADTVGGMPYDGGGWAGDGSGTDDLADYNAMEGCDY